MASLISSEEFKEFIKTFNNFEATLPKIKIKPEEIIKNFQNCNKEKILNEIANGKFKKSILSFNPLTLIGLLETTQNNELAGYIFYSLEFLGVFFYFFYLMLLQHPEQIFYKKNNNNEYEFSVENKFKDLIAKYMQDSKKIGSNLFLIKPQLLLNLVLPNSNSFEIKYMDVKFVFKNIGKNLKTSDLIKIKQFPAICKILSRRSCDIYANIILDIKNGKDFDEAYKNLVKPIISLLAQLTNIHLHSNEGLFHRKLLKIIMDCY